MSRTFPIGIVLLLAVSPAPADETTGLVLPEGSRYARHLEVAREHLEKKEWGVAVTLLQRLLDLPEDGFATVRQPAAGGKPAVTRVVSLRAEAERLLGTMPAEGLRVYRTEYGPAAAELLDQAKKLGEPARLVMVLSRYFHTDAAVEAGLRLAGHYLDRSQAVMASLCFARLLDRPGTELPPASLFQAALAFRRAGDRARADKLWEEVRRRAGKDGIDLGPRKLTPEQMRTTFEKAAPPARPPGWPMFRGDPARSGRVGGGSALLEPRWRHPLSRENATGAVLTAATGMLERAQQPLLAEIHPLHVVNDGPGRRRSLVVHRSYFGLHAWDAQNGKVHWESKDRWGLDQLLGNPLYAGLAKQWLAELVQPGRWPGAVFGNALAGTLSTDGEMVFIVETLAVAPVPAPPPLFGKVAVGPLDDGLAHNVLQGFHLTTGKLIWERGDRADGGPLGEVFFLGPPLPLAGSLYTLAERQGTLVLVTLDPGSGGVQTVRQLGGLREKLSDAVERRYAAAQLAFAHGVLVCPTNAGSVLGVDLLTGKVRWAYSYRDREEKSRTGATIGWRAAAPIVAGDRVLVAAPDSNTLACLDVREGRLLWKVPRQADDLYVAGAFGPVVMVVGARECRGVGLADGKVVWTKTTGQPSGLGAFDGKYYHLPLRKDASAGEPGIVVLDPAGGTVMARARSRKKEVPGNLIFADDAVVSVTPTAVESYPLLKTRLAEIEARLEKAPNDPEVLYQRGVLRLERGDLEPAIENLRGAMQLNPVAELKAKVEAALYDAFVEYFQRDFDRAEGYLKEFEAVCRAPDEARQNAERRRRLTHYHVLLAGGRERQKKWVEAVRAYVALAEAVPGGEMFTPPDEPDRRVAPAAWARGRIDALLRRVEPADRKAIEAELKDLFDRRKSQAAHPRRLRDSPPLSQIFGE